MHISRIDLNLLVVFDVIYAEGGITAASRKLNLSQPAVSHALGRLRAMFGDPLFERRAQSMVPTPLARSIIGPLRSALGSVERTMQSSRRFEPGSAVRRFTIGLRDLLEFTLLPQLSARVCAQGPSLDLMAITVDRHDLESELLSGTLDAALDVLVPQSPGVIHKSVLADRIVVVAAADHPRIQGALSLEQYLAHEHVHVSSRRSGPGLEDMALSRLGLTRRIRLRCRHYGAGCRVVARTQMLLTLPERYARLTQRDNDLQVLPLPFKSPKLELFLYWHANADRDPASLWLREQIVAALAEAPR